MTNKCPICLDYIKEQFILTNCKHYYHENCYFQYQKKFNHCALCRENINVEIIYEKCVNQINGARWTVGRKGNEIICSFPMWIF